MPYSTATLLHCSFLFYFLKVTSFLQQKFLLLLYTMCPKSHFYSFGFWILLKSYLLSFHGYGIRVIWQLVNWFFIFIAFWWVLFKEKEKKKQFSLCFSPVLVCSCLVQQKHFSTKYFMLFCCFSNETVTFFGLPRKYIEKMMNKIILFL